MPVLFSNFKNYTLSKEGARLFSRFPVSFAAESGKLRSPFREVSKEKAKKPFLPLQNRKEELSLFLVASFSVPAVSFF